MPRFLGASYSPIPNDVRDMCIVADEKRLPEVAAEILDGKRRHGLPSREGIKRFETSNVIPTYRQIFRKLHAGRKGE